MSEVFYRASRPSMGSILTVSLYGSDNSYCKSAAEKAFIEVSRIERLISFFDPESSLSKINCSAGRRETRIEPELARLISVSLKYSRVTRGAFDVTVNPVMRLWGFRREKDMIEPPSRKRIEETLRSTGFEKVRLNLEDFTIEYLDDRLEIDLGGIGKGYGADRAVHILKKEGVTRALASFGSVSNALGAPSGKEGWVVGIEDPEDQSRLTGTLILKDRAVSTSGGYRQFLRRNGKIYSHLIDPGSGQPIPRLSSATVVCPSATEADALSTGCLILENKKGLALLERYEEIEGQIVMGNDDGSLDSFETSGLGLLLEGRGRMGPGRRKFLKASFLAMGFLFFGRLSLQAAISPRIKHVLSWLIPGADSYREQQIELTREEMKAVFKEIGKKFKKNRYMFYTGYEENIPTGYAVILDIKGKELPITFMVSMDPEGEVMGVEVLTYRESIGGEIRSKRFLRQFRGKTLESPIRLGQDIHAITGATISSSSATYAVRKALALMKTVFGIGDRIQNE